MNKEYGDQLIQLVADYLGIEISFIKLNTRRQDVVYAKKLLVYAYHCNPRHMTLSDVGQIIGRNHSSIIYLRNEILIHSKLYDREKKDTTNISALVARLNYDGYEIFNTEK
jgi:chromosomal replication initiation ATPase DnaA